MRELIRVRPRTSVVTDLRLNLVVPSIAPATTFGGVQTATDLFRALSEGEGRRRIITTAPLDSGAIEVFPAFQAVQASDDPDDPSQLVSIAQPGATTIPVGPNDVFIATFWPTAAFAIDVRSWQASTYGRVPPRFAYLIQDFEPAFYPASAQSLLARATYDSADSTIAIFNSSLLRDSFHRSGLRFPVEYTFEPRLDPRLRRDPARPRSPRSRTILVYGRPGRPRNGFALIVEGLRAWRASFPDADRWSVVSVGQSHPDVDLGDGIVMTSVGKLNLESYAERLGDAAVGISLMISPHPSYPPLEMAQSGLLVLTNRYEEKDLSAFHTNITSLANASSAHFADALSELCRRFGSEPSIGDRGRLLAETYTAGGPQFPFAADVVELLRGGGT